MRGLSPLTRGNRRHDGAGRGFGGPIPAHAGQPWRDPRKVKRCEAYPRSRGATLARLLLRRIGQGLSPLTRGNPLHLGSRTRRPGPIPAHAGQPIDDVTLGVIEGAYPRSRGATETCRHTIGLEPGLSPLTRGNRHRTRSPGCRPRPIPAHAGQPRHSQQNLPGAWAYPRSRGATLRLAPAFPGRPGLSPLTRGNQMHTVAICGAIGPIPAHAGQPASSSSAYSPAWAYPRSRGATAPHSQLMCTVPGLSPLTRGNLYFVVNNPLKMGPIPAHAGQPAG